MEYILIGLLVLFLLYTLMNRKSENMVNCGENAECLACVDNCEDDVECQELCDDDLDDGNNGNDGNDGNDGDNLPSQ